MKQSVKSWHSPDALDLFTETHVSPIEASNLLIQVDIGPTDEEGADVFSVMVMTTDFVVPFLKSNRFEEGLRYIVLPYLDQKLIVDIIRSVVDFCNQFADPVLHLRKYFDWEYENYQYISQDALDENPMPENKEKLASWLDKQIDRAVKPGK